MQDYLLPDQYSDGSAVDVPMANRVNIPAAEKPTTFDRYFHKRHASGWLAGSERAGIGWKFGERQIDVQVFEWIDPEPDKAIESVEVAAADPGMAVFPVALSTVKERELSTWNRYV